MQRLEGELRRLGRGERADVRRAVVVLDLAHDGQPRVRLRRQPDPGHALGEPGPPVVARGVGRDEAQLAHPGLERRGARDGVDAVRDADHLDHAAALLRRREVAAHALPQRGRRRADVQHLVARSAEQVHAGAVRQTVGERALATDVLRDRVGRGGEVLEVRDAQRSQPAQERVQDVDRRLRVRERPVVGRHGRVEQGGERGQLVVGRLVARDDPAGEPHGVQHLVAGPRVPGAGGGRLEEADVERRVVRDEHRAAGELQEARQHLLDGRCADEHRGGDAGEHLDERRDRSARVDQGLELAEHLAAADLDRTDLRDRAVGRGPAGRLEVDDDERHVRQRRAEIVERGLVRPCARVPGSRPPTRGAGDGRTTWCGRYRRSPTRPVCRTGDGRRPPSVLG